MSAADDRHPREQISAWIDGELAVSERPAVESHLRDCESCRLLADDLRALDAACLTEEPPPVPSGLAARIGWRLAGANQGKRGRGRWPLNVPMTAAASLVAAALLSVVVLRGGMPWNAPEPSVARNNERLGGAALQDEGEDREARPASSSSEGIGKRQAALSKEDENNLRSLGYVGGGEEKDQRRGIVPTRARGDSSADSMNKTAAAGTGLNEKVAPDKAAQPSAVGGKPAAAPVAGGTPAAVASARDAQGTAAEKSRQTADFRFARQEADRKKEVLDSTVEQDRISPMDKPPAEPERKRLQGTRPVEEAQREQATEQAPACRSFWLANPDRALPLRVPDAPTGAARLESLASRLEGKATPLDSQKLLWSFSVSRDRWSELIAALRGLGVEELDSIPSPPPGSVMTPPPRSETRMKSSGATTSTPPPPGTLEECLDLRIRIEAAPRR